MEPYPDALYQVPDYLPAADLPDPDVGRGDPVPLAQRMRRAFPGDPFGPNAFLTVPGGITRLPVPLGALSCMLQVQVAALRYTTDGTVPSAVNGQRADVGTMLFISGYASLAAFAMAAETVTSAVVVPQFYT